MRRFRVLSASMASFVVLGAAIFGFANPAAAYQTNQVWVGPVDNNNYGYYLGQPSDTYVVGSYEGPIHNWNAGSGKCLDVPGNRFFNWAYLPYGDPTGAQVQLWDCNSGVHYQNQNWHQYHNTNLTWSYSVTEGDVIQGLRFYCLDNLAGHRYNGAPIVMEGCNWGTSQQFTIGWEGQLQSVDAAGYCADATDWGTGNGTQIQLWWCA